MLEQTKLRVLLFAAIVCGAFAAPAGAVRTEVAHMPASAPEIAGDSAVFFSFTPGKARLVRAQPGATPATLREYPLLGGQDDDECCRTDLSYAFSASSTRVAVSRFYQAFAKGFLAQSDFEIHTGPLGGELSQLFKCQFAHPYDVDGDRIAYAGDDCTEGTGNKVSDAAPRIVVRDLAAAGAPVVASFPVSQKAGRIYLAGDHVAYSSGEGTNRAISVRQLGAAADAYSVPTLESLWSVQADGKLAVSNASGSSACRIEWHSKAEPAAHRLDVCPLSRVVMAGDRIAFQGRGSTSDSLDVVGLDGARRSVVFAEPRAAFNGFDWDGARLAYGVSGCVSADDRVYFEDLTSEPPLVEGGACPVKISPKTVRASKSGLVRIKVAPEEESAAGTVVLYVGKKQASTRVIPFEIRSGAKSIPIRLNGVALNKLRDGVSVLLSARAAVTQRSGENKTYKRAIRVLPPK